MMFFSYGFNNETGLCDRLDWLMEAPWYEDEDGFLYILPVPEACAENEGPDNSVMDRINAIFREEGRSPTDEECLALGLRRIPDVLKRFHPKDGYYHA